MICISCYSSTLIVKALRRNREENLTFGYLKDKELRQNFDQQLLAQNISLDLKY
jgi:hypothetical protein